MCSNISGGQLPCLPQRQRSTSGARDAGKKVGQGGEPGKIIRVTVGEPGKIFKMRVLRRLANATVILAFANTVLHKRVISLNF